MTDKAKRILITEWYGIGNGNINDIIAVPEDKNTLYKK